MDSLVGDYMSFYINNNKIDINKFLAKLIKNNTILKKSLYFINNEGCKCLLYLENGLIKYKNIDIVTDELIKDGLIYNLEVIDNKVIDTVSNVECPVSYSIENDMFKFTSERTSLFNILSENGFTIELNMLSEEGQGLYPLMTTMRYGLDVESNTDYYYKIYSGQFSGNQNTLIKKYSVGTKLGELSPAIKNGDIIHFSMAYDNNNLIKTIQLMDVSYPISVTENINNLDVKSGYSYIPWIKSLRIYNKPLSDSERMSNYNFGVNNNILKNYSNEVRFGEVHNGLADLGSKLAYVTDNKNNIIKILETSKEVGSHTIEYNGESKNYNLFNYIVSDSDVDSTLFGTFESLHIINKPVENLKVGDWYSIRALPYPYKAGDNFFVEYSSSDENICSCVQGVLECKQVGTVTITAKLYGTEISTQCEIKIDELDIIEENKYFISSSLFYSTQTPEEMSTTLFSAISNAINNGYNYIVLPKLNYKLIPISNPCLTIGDNITIDLNNSCIFIQENEGTWNLIDSGGTKGGYCFFNFIGKNSKIINGNVYGERYKNKTHSEDEYTGYGLFCNFKVGSKRCILENINFNSTVGMNITIESNCYNYYEGIGDRGRISYKDWEFGKLDDEGNLIDSNEYIRTNRYIQLGYDKNVNPYYIVGMKGTRTYSGTGSRFYFIYWYDENYNLLEIGKYHHKFEEYVLPDGACYFKLYLPQTELPTANYGDDGCVLRCFQSKEPKFINIKRCNFINPHGGAVNYVGGQRCLLENCYISSSGAKPGMRWAIDYEDGWMNMRGNIIKNCIIRGLVVQCSGNANSYINNYISILTTKTECELGNVINNYVSKLEMHDKEIGVNSYNIYDRLIENTGLGIVYAFLNNQ